MRPRRRILVVDDDPHVRRALARLIGEPHGEFAVLQADGYAEALSLLASTEGIQAVLSDMSMGPGPGGFELLAEVRRRWPTHARLLVSGTPDVREGEDLVRSGIAHAFLPKPWPPGAVLPAVLHAIEVAKLAKGTSPPGADTSSGPGAGAKGAATQDRRTAPRVGVELTIQVCLPSWETFQQLYTMNISKGGMLFSTTPPPTIGQVIQVLLQLPNGRALRLISEVRYLIEPRSKENPHADWQVGVMFRRVSDDDQLALDDALAELLAHGTAAAGTSPPPLVGSPQNPKNPRLDR